MAHDNFPCKARASVGAECEIDLDRLLGQKVTWPAENLSHLCPTGFQRKVGIVHCTAVILSMSNVSKTVAQVTHEPKSR